MWTDHLLVNGMWTDDNGIWTVDLYGFWTSNGIWMPTFVGTASRCRVTASGCRVTAFGHLHNVIWTKYNVMWMDNG